MAEIVIFIVIGIVAGTLAGLLGIGGGLVVIPSLFMVLGEMHLAMGTSLAAMVLTTLSSSVAHYKKRGIDWHAALIMTPGVLVGAIIGPIISNAIPNEHLRTIFGGFEIVVGIYLVIGKQIGKRIRKLPSPPLLASSGLAIGTVASMLGIGGGVMTVPFLHHFAISMKRSVGTSAFISFLVMTTGASSFFFIGGDINGKALLCIALSAFVCAPFGAHLAHKLPGQTLKRFFGIFLLIAGLLLLLKELL